MVENNINLSGQSISEICDAYERGLKYGRDDSASSDEVAKFQHNYADGSNQHIAFGIGCEKGSMLYEIERILDKA